MYSPFKKFCIIHQKCLISGVCFHRKCGFKYPLACSKCYKTSHEEHLDNILEITDVESSQTVPIDNWPLEEDSKACQEVKDFIDGKKKLSEEVEKKDLSELKNLLLEALNSGS